MPYKRIAQLDAKTDVTSSDFLIIDNNNEGTFKIAITTLMDQLGFQGKVVQSLPVSDISTKIVYMLPHPTYTDITSECSIVADSGSLPATGTEDIYYICEDDGSIYTWSDTSSSYMLSTTLSASFVASTPAVGDESILYVLTGDSSVYSCSYSSQNVYDEYIYIYNYAYTNITSDCSIVADSSELPATGTEDIYYITEDDGSVYTWSDTDADYTLSDSLVAVFLTATPDQGDTNTLYVLTGDNSVYSCSAAGAWEHIGSSSVDLSNYYTKSQTNTLLSAKQNTLTFDSTPTSGSTNPVTSGGVYTALSSKADSASLAAVATSGDADDVAYDNTTSGLTATDVQAAIDEVANSGGGGGSASNVTYDNTTSGLTATDVQAAIDELESSKQDTLTFDSTPTSGSTNPVTSGGVYSALKHTYSTTEQVVGTWVDGSTLYEKSFVLTSPSSAGSEAVITTFSLDINLIISCDILLNSGNDFIPIGWQYGSSSFAITNVFARCSKTTISMSVGVSAYTSCPVYATLRYTKTS